MIPGKWVKTKRKVTCLRKKAAFQREGCRELLQVTNSQPGGGEIENWGTPPDSLRQITMCCNSIKSDLLSGRPWHCRRNQVVLHLTQLRGRYIEESRKMFWKYLPYTIYWGTSLFRLTLVTQRECEKSCKFLTLVLFPDEQVCWDPCRWS